jgi:AcrR family transcriptional regulator
VEGEAVGVRRRADAVQNREKLLDAAEAVFLEAGINVPLDVVAERAGVGRATLFRNFVDRHALITGLLDRGLDELECEALRIDGDAAALGRLLRFVAERMVARAPLIEYWRTFGHDSPDYQAAMKRFVTLFEKPVAWAVAGGACRADLLPLDVFLMATMLSGALYAPTSCRRRELTERAWMFVVEMAQLRNPP